MTFEKLLKKLSLEWLPEDYDRYRQDCACRECREYFIRQEAQHDS